MDSLERDLKSEAFDLLLEKQETVQRIDARLQEIYAELERIKLEGEE